MGEITTKQCTKCGEVKCLADFFADKRRRDGKRSVCKNCSAVSNRNYYSDNKERVKASVRSYYVKNRIGKLHYVKEHRAKNPHIKQRSDNRRRALKRNLPHAKITTRQYERLHEFRLQVFGEVNV